MLQTSLLLMKGLNKTEIPFSCSVFFVSKGILFDVYYQDRCYMLVHSIEANDAVSGYQRP